MILRVAPLSPALLSLAVFCTPAVAQRTAVVEPVADAPLGESWLARAAQDAEARQYAVARGADGNSRLVNPAHDLQAGYSEGTLRIEPAHAASPAWSLSLSTVSFGCEGAPAPLDAPAARVAGARLEIDRGPLTEWFENRPDGIELGWTLHVAPPDAAERPLWIGVHSTGSLSWRLDAGARSARLIDEDCVQRLQVAGLRAWDADGGDVPVRFGSSPDGFGVRVDARTARFPVTVDPLITSTFALVQADQAAARFGWAVCFAGDVDADGFGDVAVGAPLYDYAGFVDSGAVFVYLGSSAGLSAAPVWSFGGGQNFAEFGRALAGAGDVDGDGFDDLLIGAPRATFGEAFEGSAYLFLGSPLGPEAQPAWEDQGGAANAEFGFSVSGAGQTDGDDHADWAVGAPGLGTTGAAYVFAGSARPLSAVRRSLAPQAIDRRFGHSVAGVGNLLGSAHHDVSVGAPETTNSASHSGIVRTYAGAAGGIGTTSAWNAGGGLAANTRYGTVVAGAGDFNGDGLNDLLVGAPTSSSPFSGGTFWLYSGNMPSLAWLVQGTNTAGTEFGFSLGCAGDVNADGYADVFAGTPGASGAAGGLRIYHGSATPTVPDFVSVSLGTAGDRFGHAISAAGDVDGDGYSDLVAGSPFDDDGQTDEGTARVFRGAPETLSSDATWVKSETATAFAHWGAAVVSIGDVNGDGYEDLAASEPDVGTTKAKVWVYHGTPAGPAASTAWTLGVGAVAADRIGAALAGGDVDGDGFDDLIVGAPGVKAGGLTVGRVTVYPGSATGLGSTPIYDLLGTLDGAGFASAVAVIGDVDGDGDGELAVGSPLEGAGGQVSIHDLRPGGAAPVVTQLLAPHGNSEFGRAIASAGDVNGDGLMDLIVGAPKAKPAVPSEAGSAYVFLGTAGGLGSTPAWQIGASFPTGAHLGAAVARAGDVNGDGFGDVLAGAPDFFDATYPNGIAVLHLGGPAGPGASPAWSGGALAGAHTLGGYGAALSRAGDVDGDGFGDWIVGSPRLGVGSVALWHGGVSPGAISVALTTGAVNSPLKTAQFGAALASGDFDGNGFGDVLVGAPGSSPANEGGRTEVFLGNGGRRSILRTLTALQLDDAPIADGGRTETFGIVPVRTSLVGSLATYAKFGPRSFTLQLELEAKPLGAPFDGTDLEAGTPRVVAPGGSTLSIVDLFRACSLADLVSDVQPRSMVHWRARLKLGNSCLQHTPWIVPDGRGSAEGTLRSRP